MSRGVLAGIRAIEFAGIGPVPFCGMMLADHGADVVRIARPGGNQGGTPLPPARFDVMARGRRTITLDLKDPAAIAVCLDLIERADAVLEGFRPGVMERLGLGPDVVLARNPRVAYARMTGWGQTGPYAMLAGHDINYIAIAGALNGIGTKSKPIVPLNLVGDFGGGAMFMAFGVVSAILGARATGKGQVVDCAMTDGATTLMAAIWGLYAQGAWNDERNANIIDGAAHFYDTYRCADGEWVALGPIEPSFYRNMLDVLGLEDSGLEHWRDPAKWPAMKGRIAAVLETLPRSDWIKRFEGSDACFAPVLSMGDALRDPHNIARATFAVVDGVAQPAPAPRFSLTPGQAGTSGPCETSSAQILKAWAAS